MRRVLSTEEVEVRLRQMRGKSDPLPDPKQYRLEQSGTWYKVVDASGAQVGSAYRSESLAQAALDQLAR